MGNLDARMVAVQILGYGVNVGGGKGTSEKKSEGK